MTAARVDEQVAAAQRRLEALWRRTGDAPPPEELVGEALAELSVTLHDLQVVAAELREQNDQLTASRQAAEVERRRYQEMFEFAPDGYLLTNAQGVIQEANRAAAALLRVPAQFLVGKLLNHFVAEEDRGAFRAMLERACKEGAGQMAVCVQPREGASFPGELRVGIARDIQRRQVGLWWVVRDISDLKEAERRLTQAERLAAIGQMMTGLTHESRNALQRSKACLAMLAFEVQDRPAALDLVERTKSAQEHLEQLYEEVRGYAAPIVLRTEICPLGELLREAWSHLSTLSAARDARLREDGQVEDLSCHVDRLAIGQVFRNILENSLAACADPVVVEVAWAETVLRGGRALRIGLRDNGPGLTAEQRARIFEPFYTTKTHGTGLGMPIAKRLVEAHRGEIALGDPVGPGVEVVITLPRRTANEPILEDRRRR
jgi:PAS domain S-box-containing protein